MYFSIVFNDKRWTAGFLCVWLCVILVLFADMGVLNSSFFSIGPSETLRFMSVSIDTGAKWALLAGFCLIDTMIKTFGHDSIIIWSIHTLCDPKCSELPYPRWVCMLIMEIYHLYVHVSGVFKFFISLSQIDFVVIISIADLMMKGATYSSYMHKKTYTTPEQLALRVKEEEIPMIRVVVKQ